MLFSVPVYASTWNPLVLVNTEAFQTIDEGDSTTNVILRFGDTLNKTVMFDRTNGRFDFNDDINVQGSALISGTVTGTTLIALNNISLNADNTGADAILTFGNDLGAEALRFSDTSNWFEFSDDLRINGNLFASGSIVVDSNITADNGTLFVNSTTNQVGINTLSPNSTLTLSGSIARAVRTMAATGALTADDHVIMANAAGGSFTITLPTAVGIQGREYVINKIDSALSNAVIITTTGGQNIDGLTQFFLKTRNEELVLQSDNANWRIVQADQLDVSAYRAKGATLNRWYSSSDSAYNFSATTYTTTANTIRVTAFYASKVMTIDAMAMNITTASAGNNCRVGIYNDNGNLYPSTLVVDAGVQSTTPVGTKVFTTGMPVTVQPGLYWLAHTCSVNAIMRGISSIGMVNVLGFDATLGGNGIPVQPGIGWTVNAAFAALPAAYPAGGTVLQAAAATAGNPGIFVRTSQ